jgi:LPXTG-motif cell wall-anchored protein
MMLSKKITRAMLLLAFAVPMMCTTASAQTWDKKVYFTFSGPVEIPGATLPAGKYLFHLADPNSGRQVLQVQSADGKKVFGMFFGVPVERTQASDDPEVRFLEAPAGVPPAIATVWYAGEKMGRELIYPKDQAMRIAKATNSSVLTTTAKSTKTDEVKSGDLTRVSPSGQDTQFAQNAPAQAPTGRSQRGERDTAVADASRNTPVATSGQAAETPRRRLPQTGSEMPSVLLLGLGFLGSAAAMGFGRFDRF